MKSVYPPKATLALAALVCLLGGMSAAYGQVLSFVFDGGHLRIPDGDGVGTSTTQFVDAPPGGISELTVRLNIKGGFNGDLYVQLNHEGTHSVLLNRVGRSALSLLGYGDSGFDIALRDQGSAGDLHSYRLALSGNELSPISGPLTGTWSPDGRTTDPANVLNTDSRTALLSGFSGLPIRGQWTLYLADLDAGGQSELVSWGLDFAIMAVPEPMAYATCVTAALLVFAAAKRCRRRSD